jgi:D-3-phosphoglycerate dehydrogenase
VALQVAEQMSDFLLQGAVVNAVNMPSLSAEDAPKLKPYLRLAEQIGSFAGQITSGAIKAITIEYEGHVAGLNLRPLSAVVLKGLLSTRLETVNMVNAPVIARQHDITVTETRREQSSDYQTAIRVTVESEGEKQSVMGTLFGDRPRIVAIDGVPTEFELSSHMLMIENLDRPGFIGSLGRTLGDANINIAQFYNGRVAAGGRALCLVSVDHRIDEAIRRRIASLPHVVSVRDLTF